MSLYGVLNHFFFYFLWSCKYKVLYIMCSVFCQGIVFFIPDSSFVAFIKRLNQCIKVALSNSVQQKLGCDDFSNNVHVK